MDNLAQGLLSGLSRTSLLALFFLNPLFYPLLYPSQLFLPTNLLCTSNPILVSYSQRT